MKERLADAAGITQKQVHCIYYGICICAYIVITVITIGLSVFRCIVNALHTVTHL
jgi:hypothetical protein